MNSFKKFRLPGAFLGAILLIASRPGAGSQELFPGLKERAVVLNITTRIAENQQELWNATNSKVTLPGRPVSIKLEGGNVVMVIRFTPYLHNKGRNVLVAQGEIWVHIPNEGMSYKTTMQYIPLNFGEAIVFFPLGSDASAGTPRIELQIVLQRYEDALKNTETAPANPEAETPAGG